VRAFTCPDCRHLVTFESTRCLHSDTPLGFDWAAREMVRLGPGDACANRDAIGCNGLASPGGLCPACALTRLRPDDGDPAGLAQWGVAEAAKRRLVFELHELGLPVRSFREHDGGLGFDMRSSTPGPVVTGHAHGIVTIDVTEADPAYREWMRASLGEAYRTVLGHLRHEVAHHFATTLAPPGSAAAARVDAAFGDTSADYEAAMARHYADGPPADWQDRFVTAYATMHPWEDWAETFAHYLHIRDVLQTTIAYGVSVAGPSVGAADRAPLYAYPAATPDDLRAMLDTWLPLTYALNAITRSIGTGDLYPFVLAPAVVDKLALIDELVRGASGATAGDPA
jgi:hypothetical protein